MSNTAQKFISKALNASLEEAASALVCPVQRGFVKHRSLIDNDLDVEYVMEASVIVGARRTGTVLFDIAVAFPSVEWEWLVMAMERQGFPLCVRRLVRGMLENSSATVLFSGTLTGATIVMRRGIRQGCPSSGFLWAILFDPFVRSLTAVIPPSWGWRAVSLTTSHVPSGMLSKDCVVCYLYFALFCQRRA